MKKPYSQSKINNQIITSDDGVYTLKISNFDLQIDSSPAFIKARYDQTKRKEAVTTSYSHFQREIYNPQRDRKLRSSQELRTGSDHFEDFHKFGYLNKQIRNLSPIIQQKIVELKKILIKKASSLNKAQLVASPQNIHFTQYVLQSSYPSTTNMLHIKAKKDGGFMKSVKAKSLMSRSFDKNKNKDQDLFKSIELNNSSKYVKSKRIVIENKNQIKEERKNKIIASDQKKYTERRRSYLNRAKGSRTSRQNRCDNVCQPWETNNRDQIDDHNITQL